MNGLFLFHWSNPLLIAALLIVPLWRIYGRAGFSPAWSLLALLPWFGPVLAVLILGFLRWPIDLPATGRREERGHRP